MITDGLVAYYSGVPWEGMQGSTDHRLIRRLAELFPVLWVDPPMPATALIRDRRNPPRRLRQLAENLWCLSVLAPPGVTRPILRGVADGLVRQAARGAQRRLGLPLMASIVANPLTRLSSLPGRRVLLATDDFVEGAELMGLDRTAVESLWKENVDAADVVAGISPQLLDVLGGRRSDAVLIPNGCAPEDYPASLIPAELGFAGPVAGVVGQFNSRLDLSLLAAVADAGVQLALVGPRVQRDGLATEFDDLLSRPTVRWLGAQAVTDVPSYVAAFTVGLTPYADTPFNRASFPLKTLEYLAAGKQVVTTDLPAARWLDTPCVVRATTTDEFVSHVVARLSPTATDAAQCRSVAAAHSWSARAVQLAGLIADR